MTTSNQLIPIGWREQVELPDWGLRRIRAKIDTGARTCAIDVAQIEHLPDGRVRFKVVARTRPKRRTKWIEADAVRTTTVRSSTGQSQERVICLTRLVIGAVDQVVEISLVRRRGMLCRMLVGRRAIAGVFAVDVSHKFLATRRPGSRGQPTRDPKPRT